MSNVLRIALLDASALVKLVVDECGTAALKQHLGREVMCFSTILCVAEALNVLKRKHLEKKISQEQYLDNAYELMALIKEKPINLLPASLEDPSVFFQTEDLAKKHGLDLSDALQLHALKIAPLSYYCGGSTPLLVSADRCLVSAARGEGLTAWNCQKEAPPAP